MNKVNILMMSCVLEMNGINDSTIIVLSGVDGTGKTSIANKLFFELKKNNKKVKYVWMRGRGRVFFSLPLLALSRFIKLTVVTLNSSGKTFSHYFWYKNYAFSFVYIIITLIDVILYNIFLVYFPLKLGYTLIIDRCPLDTMIDLYVDTKVDEVFKYSRFFMRTIPNDALFFILDVPSDVAFNRKKDIYNIEYINQRKTLYQYLCKLYNYNLINANRPIELVYDEIRELIRQSERKS